MDLDTSKSLGGIGSILIVIAVLGFFGSGWAGILVLVGIVMVLIAMKGLSDYYNEGGIFNNALYGVLTTIVGAVAFVAVFVVTFLYTVSTWEIDWTNPNEWATFFQGLTDLSALFPLIGSVIAAFVVAFVFAIVAAIFYRKSFNLLATKSGVNMFATAGLIMLIGAILTIVLIGFIIIWVAFILLAVGFFSIRRTTQQPPTAEPQQPSS